MAKFFRNFLDSMKFPEDDDDYEEYLSEQREKEYKRGEKPASQTYISRDSGKNDRIREPENRFSSSEPAVQRNITPFEDRRSNKPALSEKPKVVQFKNSSYREELGLYVSKPKAFTDCQDISDILLSETAVVINLEEIDDDIAQRVMDFVSGTVYAINGTLNTVSKCIFLASPESVSISGDVETLLSQSIGGNAPTITRGF